VSEVSKDGTIVPEHVGVIRDLLFRMLHAHFVGLVKENKEKCLLCGRN